MIRKYTGRPSNAAASIRNGTPDPSGAGPTQAARVSANTGTTGKVSTGENLAGSSRASTKSSVQSTGPRAAARAPPEGLTSSAASAPSGSISR